MSNDKSILLRLDERGAPAPRVKLKGTERNESATARYEVIGELARGGVGIVHRGRDNDVGRDVALKVLRDEHLDSPELVQRFVEEAQIGGQLQHPGIVPVYELGLRADRRPYFAMKLVKGDTLAARLAQRKGPADGRRALLRVFRDVCRTMAYAHARGVIHRDLKPSNVMIGNFGEVQVVDWGFAKVMRRGGVHDERLVRKAERDVTMVSTVRTGEGSSASVAGSVMGTPAYMPPEQALGRVDDLDERSDLFSLGAILAEILTGTPPYTGAAADRMTAAAQAQLGPINERLDACGADGRLVRLCKTCLEPLPKDRPAGANEVADAIAAYLTSAERRAHDARMRALESEAKVEERRRERRQTVRMGACAAMILVVSLAAYFYVDADRTRRAAERHAAIELALQDAGRLRAAGEWDAAEAAADRASELGYTGAMAEEIRAAARKARVLARREEEDDRFLAELEQIRARRTISVGGSSPSPSSSARDDVRSDADYTAAFRRRFGSVEASAERLIASRHAEAFAANLGFWCWIRKVKLQQPDWQVLDRLARRIDPRHAEIRDALIENDVEALLAVTRKRDADLPLALAAQVGLALASTKEHVPAAVRFLERQALRAPGDFWIRMRLAYAAQIADDKDLWLTSAAAATAIRPDHPMAWRSLVSAHYDSEDYDGTIAVARHAIARGAADAGLYTSLGGALSNSGRLDEALDALRKALEIDPEHAQAHVFTGVTLLAKGDEQGALEAHRRATECKDTYATAFSRYGALLCALGQMERGMAALRHALESEPAHHNARLNLGVGLIEQGEYEEAIRVAREGLELKPDDSEFLGQIGLALVRLERFEESIPVLRRAIELDSKRVSDYINLGHALAQLGRQDASREAYERAVELDPDSSLTQEAIAGSYARLGQHEKAIAAYEKAITRDPANARLYARLALSLLARGRSEDALAACRKALELDPSLGLGHRNLARTCLSRKDYPAAIEAAKRAVAVEPEALASHTVLAQAYSDSGDLEGLRATLEKGLAAHPDHERFRVGLAEVTRAIDLRTRLPAIIAGKVEPASWKEALLFAELATDRRYGVEGSRCALRLFRRVFEENPKIAEDLGSYVRYNAACAAAMAGSEFHEQALKWLNADLDARAKQREADPARFASLMEHWKRDPDLAAIRDGRTGAFKQLWDRVDALLARTR